jgi:hypothetical protein
MAIIYTTGPAHIFSVIPRGGTFYLGTCEEKPRIVIRRRGRPVRNDIAGEVPMDLSYMGQEAIIGLDLTRFNEPIVALIDSYPITAAGVGGGGPRGTDLIGDIGTLMVTEGANIGIIIQFPYSAFAPFGGVNAMPPGYFFPFCMPIPEEPLEVGTQARITHLMFHAIRGYTPANGNQLLYTTTLPALPGVN